MNNKLIKLSAKKYELSKKKSRYNNQEVINSKLIDK